MTEIEVVIKSATTKQLVEELESREGVSMVTYGQEDEYRLISYFRDAEANAGSLIKEDTGPAKVLIVID